MLKSLGKIKKNVEGTLSSFRYIAIDLIDTGQQPRHYFEDIEEFADSIAQTGKILQNLTVSKASDGRFLLAMGERRLRACKVLVERGDDRFNKVPCNVVDFSGDEERFSQQVDENMARRKLHAFDQCMQAVYYRDMFDNKTGWKGRFCAKHNVRASDLSRVIVFEEAQRDFVEAVFKAQIVDYGTLNKLYKFYARDPKFIISALNDGVLVKDIVAYFKNLDQLEKPGVAKVKVKPIEKVKFDKFIKLLKENNIDIGDDLNAFIDKL